MKTKRLTMLAILLSISIVLAIVEAFLPVIPVPGVKLGLANVVTLIVMYYFGEKDAFTLLLMRIVLVALLRGNIFSVTFFLSLSGGLMAYLMMFLTKKARIFSIIGVSIMGAFGHSLGQIMMAIYILDTLELVFYFPYILLLSVITGVITGFLAYRSYNIMQTI